MKGSALSVGGILVVSEKAGSSSQDRSRLKSVSWLKRLSQEVRASFRAPFESDWEQKTGLHWREWGKL